MPTPVTFYIITPSYNALSWLQRCVRSVADQVRPGLCVHHHVQDGGSTDGTREWLDDWKRAHADTPGFRFSFESARDRGMYDALNIAWQHLPADADITAHLNSDEQYLPGALEAVAARMQDHPRADLAVASYLVLDKEGSYLCHRRPTHPSYTLSRTLCQIITCACFHRAERFRRLGIRFDTSYRAMADLIFYRDIMATKPQVLLLPRLFTSAFYLTGSNLSWSELWQQDQRRLDASLPPWLVRWRPVLVKWNNAQNLLCDLLCRAPSHYAVYDDAKSARRDFSIRHPRARWVTPNEDGADG